MTTDAQTPALTVVGRKSRAKPNTVGFGVPDNSFPHQFIVQVPSGTKMTDVIELIEDFGAMPGQPDRIVRAQLPRRAWSRVRQQLQHYLNARLRARGLKTSKFAAGTNRVDRLLGREICLLFWGLEAADNNVKIIDTVHHNWLGYTPEEMWWMFQQVAKDCGRHDSPVRGWRQAVRQVLNDRQSGPDKEVAAELRKKPVEAGRPHAPKDNNLDLFEQ